MLASSDADRAPCPGDAVAAKRLECDLSPLGGVGVIGIAIERRVGEEAVRTDGDSQTYDSVAVILLIAALEGASTWGARSTPALACAGDKAEAATTSQGMARPSARNGIYPEGNPGCRHQWGLLDGLVHCGSERGGAASSHGTPAGMEERPIEIEGRRLGSSRSARWRRSLELRRPSSTDRSGVRLRLRRLWPLVSEGGLRRESVGHRPRC